MPRKVLHQLLRTTRANLDTQAGSNNLNLAEPYFITDENGFAIGTAANSYVDIGGAVPRIAGSSDTGAVLYNGNTALAGAFSGDIWSVSPGFTPLFYSGAFIANQLVAIEGDVSTGGRFHQTGSDTNEFEGNLHVGGAILQDGEAVLDETHLTTSNSPTDVGAIIYNANTPVAGGFHGGTDALTGSLLRLNYSGMFVAQFLRSESGIHAEDRIQQWDDTPSSENIYAGVINFGGAIKESGVVTSTLTGTQHNFNPSGLSNVTTVRLNPASGLTITGIVPTTAPNSFGNSGRKLRLINVSASTTVTLANQHTSSAAANRFICPDGANHSLLPGQSVELVYDGTTSRWRVMTRHGIATTQVPGLMSSTDKTKVDELPFPMYGWVRRITDGTSSTGTLPLFTGTINTDVQTASLSAFMFALDPSDGGFKVEFASTLVYGVYVVAVHSHIRAVTAMGVDAHLKLQFYNGSTWSDTGFRTHLVDGSFPQHQQVALFGVVELRNFEDGVRAVLETSYSQPPAIHSHMTVHKIAP